MAEPYNDASDYRGMRAEEEAFRNRGDGVWESRTPGRRFVPIDERRAESALPARAVQGIARGKFYFSWKGIRALKDPLDLALYSNLLWELKPRTIIEFGSYSGGSAVWLADTLRSFGLDGRVYSIDNDPALLDPRARAHPDVSFLHGDCARVASVLPPALLAELPHPWLVIEDAHVNLTGLLGYLHDTGLQPGDYLIVEDTNPEIPAATGAAGLPDAYEPFGTAKLEELTRFLQTHRHAYAVDTYYTDFFGYNATWNWNSYLRRMSDE